ncbi:MAG: hypothetical protein CM15mP83_5660 [Flavobacteriaceae bacterium]|nr:MAG: hypothetical protein CM15mP83_5660 [Flavobacteriaceae bacterium]
MLFRYKTKIKFTQFVMHDYLCTKNSFGKIRARAYQKGEVKTTSWTWNRPIPCRAFSTNANSESIINEFVEETSHHAGRLMSRRIQGKASFAELQDSKGRIQVYFNRDILCPDEDKTMYNDVYKNS